MEKLAGVGTMIGRTIATMVVGLLAGAALGQVSQAPQKTVAPAPLPLAVAPLKIDGPYGSTIRLEASNRLRGEFVDWFATPATSTTPTYRYDFLGNRLQLGARVSREPYEMFVQFQSSTLAEVPDDATGVGSIYYANTRRHSQNGAILRQAWLSVKRPFGVDGISVKGGRMLYSDAVDAPATHANLKWLQSQRLSQRLFGPFDYPHIGRSFDGGQIGYDVGLLNLTGFGFVPTYGGFEVDANRELDITIGGLALNLKESEQLGPMIGRLFWYYYGDRRDVVFLDNRPLPRRQADRGQSADLHTIGAHLVRLQSLGPGSADGLLYAFGQFGDWQSQQQRAWAYGAEMGYRFDEIWAKPWMRAGINSASGDTNPNDSQHGTFFQMLPTAWLYAQFPFYNMMNNQDVFVQWLADPHPMFSLRLDLHWLRLNSSRDLAYFGGGATKNDFFGFGGINGSGRNELAYVAHTMLTFRPTAFLTLNGLYCYAWGQGVINQAYAGRGGNYGFLEALVAF
jgi:hypothetical protein